MREFDLIDFCTTQFKKEHAFSRAEFIKQEQVAEEVLLDMVMVGLACSNLISDGGMGTEVQHSIFSLIGELDNIIRSSGFTGICLVGPKAIQLRVVLVKRLKSLSAGRT